MILTVVQLLLSLGLIGLVLIQHGRGADAGAAFGSGASSTVFGSRGSGSFLSRATAVLATLFFLTSMALAYFAAQSGKVEDLMDGVQPVQAPAPVEMPQVDLPPIPVSVPAGSGVPLVPDTATDVPTVRVERVQDAPAPAPEAGDVPQVPAGDGADSAPAVAPGETTGEGSK
jgi:preprotein translocase subunit SecG